MQSMHAAPKVAWGMPPAKFGIYMLRDGINNNYCIFARFISRIFALIMAAFCMVSHQLAIIITKFHLLDIIHKKILRMSG